MLTIRFSSEAALSCTQVPHYGVCQCILVYCTLLYIYYDVLQMARNVMQNSFVLPVLCFDYLRFSEFILQARFQLNMIVWVIVANHYWFSAHQCPGYCPGKGAMLLVQVYITLNKAMSTQPVCSYLQGSFHSSTFCPLSISKNYLSVFSVYQQFLLASQKTHKHINSWCFYT